ncbi:MAG: amylo-alpha-1,6-glucosidase [Bacteroidota bacterium]|nr:amylo-alpha-1,6-glucosidase [Bacteroidota bacterium]
MSYIQFDKSQLVNLEYSLDKELIRTNRAGAYSSSTIIGCNTRKYHGLLVVPQPAIDDKNHVLLSSLDLTIIQRDSEFNLGIHKFPGGIYNPKGHKYIVDFTTEPLPKLTYRVGGVVLTKELLLVQEDDRVLIKYKLEEAHSPTRVRFKPFLAFRNVHSLSKANVFVDSKYTHISNGIKLRMYVGYSYLNMQFSKENEFIAFPDWYYNIEYSNEQERGYEAHEDLYVPGYFELDMKKGEEVVFSAGLDAIDPAVLTKLYNSEFKKRIPRNSFENNLINSAQQFVVRNNKRTEIVAGYPWFGRWGRDTFISLPGLTLAVDDSKTCKAVIDTMLMDLNGPLFPNVGAGVNAALNSVDAPLWFFWSLQKYAEYTDTKSKIWKEYGKKMQLILNGYRHGTQFNIKMLESGLIYAGEQGKALTWMDAVVAGKPVTPRIGMNVEINALWYNAIMFSLEVARLAKDDKFVKEWEELPSLIEITFKETFWDKPRGYLADYVNGDYKDWSIRPNQIIATSLPYCPISEAIRKLVIDAVQAELLTPRGLRTLSPKDPNYKGSYSGDQATRDFAYHQGTVWPWLLGHFVEGYLKIHKQSGLFFIKNLYHGFESAMKEYGIGTIAEIYEGDPPHKACGAISQAWSVSELLRIKKLIEEYD